MHNKGEENPLIPPGREFCAVCVGLVLSVILASPVYAQVSTAERVGDLLYELPDFKPIAKPQGGILPPIVLPKGPDIEGLAGGEQFTIEKYVFKGNTIISDAALAELADPYRNQFVSFAQLQKLRDKITLAYVNKGYINSGAIIPSQTITDGVLEIQILEGTLADIEIESQGRFDQRYFKDRLSQSQTAALNVYELEERLLLMQQDERIKKVQAALVPSKTRGASTLRLQIDEHRPYDVQLQLNNYQVPSVGAEQAAVNVVHKNLTGAGDRLRANVSASEGARSAGLSYARLLNARDTTLEFYFRHSDSEIVEERIRSLDIESRVATVGMLLTHPVQRTLRSQWEWFVTSEYRRSKSFLLGAPFSFSDGVEDGEARVAVLRFGQDWLHRSESQVIAARSTLSFGLDALGATQHEDDIPDSQFVSLLAQVQWARRIHTSDMQLIARADMQFSDSPLLGLEQFAIGGHRSVRGYRENLFVKDNGISASLELKIPFWRANRYHLDFSLLPFFDVGHAWYVERSSDYKTLMSVGLGARFAYKQSLLFSLDWAEALRDIPTSAEHDLQDSGVHFSVSTHL